jgi:hypothetical protein
MTTNTPLKTSVTARDSNGRMLAPLPGGAAPITSANARSMAQKRWDNYRREIVKRVTGEAASIDPEIQTPAQAAAFLVASQYTKLLDQDKPAVDQAVKLLQVMAGVSETGNSQRANESTPGTISASPDTLMQLVDIIERQRSAAVDQARAVDGTVSGRDNG